MGVRITQAFCDVAQPATEELRKEIGKKNDSHAWDLANWHGEGTMVLHMLPPSVEYYHEHKEAYDKFWDALRKADYLKTEPKEDTCWIRGNRNRFSVSAVIKNLEYTGSDDGGEFEP